MHTNPFDDVGGLFSVLVNAEGQHSLWPVAVEVPAGWRMVCAPATHADCLDYVQRNWTDMRPQTLHEAVR